MTSTSVNLSAEYWQTLNVTRNDIEFLQNHLFDVEIPFTVHELAQVFVAERIRVERETQSRRQKLEGDGYLPQENYQPGQRLFFPALGMRKGQVLSLRPGNNPEIGDFSVVEIEMEDGSRKMFATGLPEHKLNFPPEEKPNPSTDPVSILEAHGPALEKKLTSALLADESLVRIAGRWFPRALLVDINVGQLNLAEAILEMASGEPIPTAQLMEQLEIPAGVNARLTEFSLNFFLQEDARFDEVGPAGEVLWCLRRQEPAEVQNVPPLLQYHPVDYDRSALSPQMLALEAELDDELSEADIPPLLDNEVTIALTYPHWRSGTLPVSNRVRALFPTAIETPRVRFTLVDAKTGQKIPAWVVRENGYVFGLKAWYESNKLIPGALLVIRRSKNPAEVILEAKTHRPTKDWVRTVIAGSDGGLVFSLLRQEVACEFDDRMVVVVPSVAGVDAAFEQFAKSRRSLERLLKDFMAKLADLTPQGHVHAEELYSAINLLYRIPPAPLFATLVTNPAFTHVGDLYFRLSGTEEE